MYYEFYILNVNCLNGVPKDGENTAMTTVLHPAIGTVNNSHLIANI